MIDIQLVLGVLAGVFTLLLLILYFKVPAFISLLIGSMVAGLGGGLSGVQVMETIKTGMGSTLGFVATVVGLGAMFGAVLEKSGGAKSLANFLLRLFGPKKAPLAMVISGFIIAIPVFFDVAFILLVPVLYALQKSSGKSLLLYAIPLLSGLAITHSFIPPTPGPVAVADIVGADLGWVIVVGMLVGIPTMLISGLWFGKYISNRIIVAAPEITDETNESIRLAPVGHILWIIAIPIVLIVGNTFITSGLLPVSNQVVRDMAAFIGHPFSALIIANLIAWYVLGIRRGFSPKALLDVTTKAMAPAGTIILLTGAGGVFKQVLIETGAGEMLAQSLANVGLPLIVFAFLSAVLVRILQGSATVAMITAAGLVAPLLPDGISGGQLATVVIAIASGASILSHVNDSGFWLVKEYLGLTEKQTFKSWSIMTTILAFTGFLGASLLYLLL